MKHQDVLEMERTAEVISDPPKLLTTRKEKLMHLASLVRALPADFKIGLMGDLENLNSDQVKRMSLYYADGTDTIFGMLACDPVMQASGYKATGEKQGGGRPTGTLGDVTTFLGITQHECHAFGCNCGGEIGRDDMADRIENLANK